MAPPLRQQIARTRSLSQIGNSVGISQPIDILRKYDLVDENDEPREDVPVELALEEREDGEYLVSEIPLDRE